MEKTLITFARNRIAYTIIRSLSQRGIKIVAADSIDHAMGYYSRYTGEHFVYPNFHKDEKGFIDCLIRESQKRGVKIIIPVHEESFVIARHAGIFKKNNLKIAIPSKNQISIAHNKSKITAVAKKLNIYVPKTLRFISQKDFLSKIQTIKDYPVIIKLVKTRGGIGYQKIYNSRDLKKQYLKIVKEFGITKEDDFPIIQEFIDGYGLGVSLLFNEGKVIVSFTHKRIWEYPPEGGFSLERISVRHKKAELMAKKLLTKLKWHGVAMVEFRVNYETGKPYLLEVNPRFWGSLNQAVASGVDFPYLTYLVARRIKLKIVNHYKIGVRTRWLAGMIVALPLYLKSKKRWQYLYSFFKFYAKNLYYDDFSFLDPIPFFVEFVKPITDLLKGKSIREEDLEEVKTEYSSFNFLAKKVPR